MQMGTFAKRGRREVRTAGEIMVSRKFANMRFHDPQDGICGLVLNGPAAGQRQGAFTPPYDDRTRKAIWRLLDPVLEAKQSSDPD